MTSLCTPTRSAESTLRLTSGYVELSEWPCNHGGRAFGFLIRRPGERDWQMSYAAMPDEPARQALDTLLRYVDQAGTSELRNPAEYRLCPYTTPNLNASSPPSEPTARAFRCCLIC